MDKESKTKQYRFFWQKEPKHFVQGTLRMIRFARQNNVDTIVVGGTSAQPVAYLFRYLWNQLFPKEKKPKFYALGLMPREVRDKEELAKRIRSRFPSIANANIIMILEEFAASGRTAEHIKKALKAIGKEVVFKTTLFSSERARQQFDLVGSRFKNLPKSHGVRRNTFTMFTIIEPQGLRLKTKECLKADRIYTKLLRTELREIGKLPKRRIQRLRRVM